MVNVNWQGLVVANVNGSLWLQQLALSAVKKGLWHKHRR